MKFALRALTLALLVSFAIVSAHAAVLVAPIAAQTPDSFGPCAGCTQLAYLSDVTSNVTNTLHFTLNTAVYSDPGNTFCAGCLDFVYQVINSNTSTDNIGRVTGFNFGGAQTDVGISTGGEPAGGGTAFVTGTDAPGFVDRNTDDTIGFQFASTPFSSSIPPGDTSVVMVIETDKTVFGGGIASVIDGGATNVNAFQPSPEPATALLLGLGMLGLAGIRRYRRS